MNRKFSLQNRNRTEILLFGMYIVTLKSGVVDVEPYNIIVYWSFYIIDTNHYYNCYTTNGSKKITCGQI